MWSHLGDGMGELARTQNIHIYIRMYTLIYVYTYIYSRGSGTEHLLSRELRFHPLYIYTHTYAYACIHIFSMPQAPNPCSRANSDSFPCTYIYTHTCSRIYIYTYMHTHITIYIHTFVFVAQAPNTFFRANSDSIPLNLKKRVQKTKVWMKKKKEGNKKARARSLGCRVWGLV